MGEPKAGDPPGTASAAYSEPQARFRGVYGAHYHLVLGYVLRRTAAREDAEDIVAETFLAAWRRLDDVPKEAGGRLWLYAIARNTLANHRRGERRRGRLAGRLHEQPGLAWPATASVRSLVFDPETAELLEERQEVLPSNRYRDLPARLVEAYATYEYAAVGSLGEDPLRGADAQGRA